MNSHEQVPKIVQEAEQIVTEAYQTVEQERRQEVKKALRETTLYIRKMLSDPVTRAQIEREVGAPMSVLRGTPFEAWIPPGV